MHLRRLATILANACAILLLGLVGVAVAGPSLVFGSLDLYGPEFFSGFYSIDIFTSGHWSPIPSDFVTSTHYVVQNVSDTVSLLNEFTSQLLSSNIRTVVALPANDSLFTSVPEPIGLSLVVSGVAALAFVRRRFRRSPRD